MLVESTRETISIFFFPHLVYEWNRRDFEFAMVAHKFDHIGGEVGIYGRGGPGDLWQGVQGLPRGRAGGREGHKRDTKIFAVVENIRFLWQALPTGERLPWTKKKNERVFRKKEFGYANFSAKRPF